MLKFLGVFCLFFVLCGCGVIPFRPFPLSVEMREYKGIILYNAGPAKDESAWQEIFVEVDWNSLWLSLCIGADAGWVARARPVILYSESLFVAGVKAGGINDQIRIYISDKRSRDSFSHEWLHSYLFLAKDYPAGDIFHADPLWKTCGFI